MNTPDRSSVVKVSCAVLACAAAWHFGVRPQAAQLADRRAELAARVADLEQGRSDAMMVSVDPEQAIQSMRTQAQGLRRLWALTQGDSTMFDALNALARRAGVVVQRIEPARGGAEVARPDAASGISAETIGFTMQLTGPLDSVGAFLRLIEHEAGMSRVQSARVSPASGQPGMVEALVVTSHVVFDGGLKAFDEPQAGAHAAADAQEARP